MGENSVERTIEMSEPKVVNRRRFIERSALGMAAAAAPLIASGKGLGANEKIIMGLIGAGGRGRHLMAMTQTIEPAVQFVAVSDAYEPRRALGLEMAGTQAKGFVDYRQLLDLREIDAVYIATPEHLHGTQLLAAVAEL